MLTQLGGHWRTRSCQGGAHRRRELGVVTVRVEQQGCQLSRRGGAAWSGTPLSGALHADERVEGPQQRQPALKLAQRGCDDILLDSSCHPTDPGPALHLARRRLRRQETEQREPGIVGRRSRLAGRCHQCPGPGGELLGSPALGEAGARRQQRGQ